MLLFTGTPEWLAAITPTVSGILGWVVAMPLARRSTYPPGSPSTAAARHGECVRCRPVN
jgi:hypothetical protein